MSAPKILWPSQAPSTSRGLNDRVRAEEAAAFRYSICLIRVTDLRLQVFAPHASFDVPRRRVQGLFTYGDMSYRLWVTDPVIEREYLAKEDGTYQLGESHLTVSLGEESTDEYCYKLIAAVLHRARVEKGG